MTETCSEIVEKTPEQWIEQYDRYRNNQTVDSVSRIIKSDMTNIARTCVSVGFHLKIARDRELYKNAGYGTLWEYAADQFGLSMGSASRYIAINDLFSIGGNTPILQEEYRSFSKSQLQEMITLSPEQRKNVTEKTTVRQIREMKDAKKRTVRDTAVDSRDAAVDTTHEEIPGQIQVEDYSDVVPEESVATSQMRKCMYRPEKTCSLSPEEQKTKGDGTDCGHTCCWNCINHGACNMECSSSEGRPENEDEEQEPENDFPEKAIEYDRRTLLDMIADTENLINAMKDYWIKDRPYVYAKYFMQLQAFRMLLELHDREEADGAE